MKKHAGLEARRKKMSPDVKRAVEFSFAVANRIHEILESKGMTQRQFANKLGKKESEVSKWMRGTHNFTCNSIAKLECALGESIIQIASSQHSVYVLQVPNGISNASINMAIRGKQAAGILSQSVYAWSGETIALNDLCEQLN